MDNIIKQLKNGAKHTRLSFSEKSEMKNVLLHHVKIHPAGSSVFQKKSIPSPFSIQSFRNTKTLPILVIAGLLVGSSVSFAAENAVPGDILFPVKINVNERVRGAITIDPKAKALWEVRLAERRLEEVEKLATNIIATNEVKLIAEKNFETYNERVKQRISKLEKNNDSEDAIDTAGTFRDMLRKHEEAIDYLDNQKKESNIVQEMDVQNTTTTSEQYENKKNPLLRDVREKLRDARGEAEKKHEELKEKYNKDNKSMVGNLEQAEPKENFSTKNDLQKKDRLEEIRSNRSSEKEQKYENE